MLFMMSWVIWYKPVLAIGTGLPRVTVHIIGYSHQRDINMLFITICKEVKDANQKLGSMIHAQVKKYSDKRMPCIIRRATSGKVSHGKNSETALTIPRRASGLGVEENELIGVYSATSRNGLYVIMR